MNKTIVFVYGTLLRGNSNHQHFLGQSRFLGRAVLRGYALYNLGSYPGIVESHDDLVRGELYEVDEPTLKRLNYLEGEGSLYALKTSSVEPEDGAKIEAGIYVYLHAVNPAKKVSIDKQPWSAS